MNADALYNLTHGIYILGAKDNQRLVGSVVDAVMQVANKPIVLALSCHNNSFTKETIEKSGEFSLSVIAKDINPFVIANFGFQSSRDVDKWEKVEYIIEDGLPYIKDCLAVAACKVIHTQVFESNTLFLAEVMNCANIKSGEPLTYLDYRNYFKNDVIKFLPTILKAKENKNV